MNKQDKKQKDLETLARKGGNDATLLLLDKIHEIEDKLDVEPPIDQKVERIALRLASKLTVAEDGEIGAKGSNGDKGDKGDRGEAGKNGKDGKNGLDGIDGEDGKTIIKETVMQVDDAVLAFFEEELEKVKTDITAVKQTPQRTGWGAHPLVIQGSGTVKTKVARTINFTGATVTQSVDGITTVAVSSSASPLTTKGDIYTRSSSADARLPVGTDGQVISADSTQATGLKYITLGGGSGDMVLASNQVVTGLKTFGSAGAVSKFALAGTTSGSTIVDASAVASGTITIPAATDTLVGKATTDTLTNKTINLTSNTLVATSAQVATAVTDETGSGALVFATSPTLVTPALGTPASGVATNLTGTASGLTAGNVTTNANLTGHVTSTGNATLLGSFTKAQLNTAISDGDAMYLDSADTITGAKTFSTAPVLNALPTGSAIASAATASTIVTRDASANTNVNNLLQGYTTTATAAGTTTLVVGSTYLQFFTGSTTQTLVLPVTSTLVLGQQYYIKNNSTGAVTIQSSGGNTVRIIAGGARAMVTCILTSGTSAASWSAMYMGISIVDGKLLTANNNVTFSGTDGVAMDVSNNKLASVTGFFDGGGSAVVNGTSSICVPAVFAGTITAYTITVDTGTCTIKTWKKATGTAIPTVADSISTSGVAISTGTVIRSTTVSDFTSTTVTANDLLIFNITAISGATKISISLEITKN